MAKVIVPICAIRYEEKYAFPLEAVNVLYALGCMDDDWYTCTMRVDVPHEPERAEIRQALKERLPAEEANRLIKFLDANEWDVSFFVDSYEESEQS